MLRTLDRLPTEQRNPASRDLDRLSVVEILRLINREDRRVPAAVAAEIPRIARAVAAVVRALRAGGRVVYVGAGTSGRIGLLDALEWPPTFGVRPDRIRTVVAGGARATIGAAAPAEDDRAGGAAQIRALRVGRRDVVVGLTASGVTPFVLGAVDEARRRGAVVVGVTSAPGSPLARTAHVAITPRVGPEVLTGSTRMKAGTAQKLVLNMLSTAAMVRLGKVYSNLMVDVVPSNRKLLARAWRIVAEAAGVDAGEAARLLRAAGGRPKVAIVMALARCSRAAAERRLARAGGHVRRAVGGAAARR
ncbi:MAG: N-acetylmuramic acid 6-phosphate etherase [Armatimonadota bacterium]|nr:N-acetylmuramic acid 6-phosphate etherase [Armatimonadota bacterium]MDR7485017.1 N-acetylmuramic acid 6-phosphate etherase [Armatimonadota bacterium]MDR7533682.1 N-acetylmuramic acid 6-phosphate etherase [Armatimonadota bacterium]MDR7535531.1 N-acetylmuramic acid 6-phosphate etherase [Armatimonadota bacterium]